MIDHAEEAQFLARVGTELMPGPGRNRDQIMRLHLPDRVPQQTRSTATQDHHGVHVLMPLEGGVSARLHLEVAQLAAEIGFGEEYLPRDRPEGSRAFLLVRVARNVRPAKPFLRGTQTRRLFDVAHW